MTNIADAPREKLREIVARDGNRILEDSDRCEGLLKDYCGEHRREISALVGALEERVPMELRSSWQTAMTPEAMRARLVQRLQDNRGLAPEVADWAVDAWSYALGVGLGRTSDRLASQVVGSPAGLTGNIPQYQQAAGQWVGSQVVQQPMGGPPPPPPPPPPAQLYQGGVAQDQQMQQPAPTGNALKVGAVVAALAIAGYMFYPRTPSQPQDTCAKRDANGNCLDGKPEPPVKVVPRQPVMLSAGTQLSMKVPVQLSSATATQGQYINSTLTAAVVDSTGKVMIPAGAKAVMQITEVDNAGRLFGVPHIKLAVYQIEANGKTYLAGSTPFVAKGPSRTVNTAKKGGIAAGIGCGVGTVIGVIKRKPKTGCGVGAGAGGATGVALAARDEIQPAVIHAGTEVRFTLVRPIQIG